MRTFLSAVLSIALVLIATMGTAQQNYRVKAGDQISVEVLEDPSLNRSVVVLPDGQFSFPFAGSLRAAGRSVGEIQGAITSAIASNFAEPPTVFVSIAPAPTKPRRSGTAARRTIDVYFIGEVNNTGKAEVEPGTTFLQALSQAGGLTAFAADRRVQLRRGTGVIQVNYRALSDGSRMSRELVLQDGDVILVPERRLFE